MNTNPPADAPTAHAASPASPPAASSPASTRLIVGALGATVLLDSFVQVLWKRVAVALPDSSDPWALGAAVLHQPAAWLLIALFLVQLVLWMRLLKHVDLSFAQPITSLSYLGVGLLSVWVLGEPFSLRKGVSIGLILCGVWLISGTPMRTAGRGLHPRQDAHPASPEHTA